MAVVGDLTSIPGLFLPFGRGWPVDQDRDLTGPGEWQQAAYAYRDVAASSNAPAPIGGGGKHVKFPRQRGPRRYGPRG